MLYQPDRNMKKLAAVWVTGLLMLAMTGVASAGIYNDRTTFNAQGIISFNSNFQDFPTGLTPLSPPFKRGDVTYIQLEGIAGKDSGYTKTEQLLGGQIISADIATAPKYNMFGFDMARIGGTTITITLYSDQHTYNFPSMWVSNADSGNLSFGGGTLLNGEYFTGFTIVADNTYNAVGITNVTLGHSPAPEPSTYALMLVGGLFVAFRLKKSVAGSAITA